MSTVICAEDGGFHLDHAWELTPDWRVISLQAERLGAEGRRTVRLDREGTGWRVNGQPRPDLDGAGDPDLSITPFCNTLPIRRTPQAADASLVIEVAYVNGTDLTVTRSRQRYDRQGADRVHFTDLGVSLGFEADLHVDDRALVLSYQHLFERVQAR